jgi:hemin uptake protein HemP
MHAVPVQPLPVSAIPAAPARRAPQAVEIDSARLLEGRREVLIRHGGECYRLRHTRNDKLILTK